MQRLILLLYFLLSISRYMANDGAFFASGTTLIPLQETDISLKKELLMFKIKDYKWMDVSVDFEFFNPGAEKKITVGFVTPPADGDVESEHPKIKNFTVNINGNTVEYKIKRMSQTSFSSILKKEGDDFVYYFDVVFKPGLNIIKHTYLYQGSNSVEIHRSFDYQITTGKRWANKQIDNFELQIHLDKGIFYVPETFWKNKKKIDWKIVGDGVFKTVTECALYEDLNNTKVRYVHLNTGYLNFKASNFAPDYDIEIGENQWYSWNQKLLKPKLKNAPDVDSLGRVARYFDSDAEVYDSTYCSELTFFEIKILRNYFYALAGIDFKDAKLKKYYAQFFWYKPNAAIKPEDIKLTYKENKFIAHLKKLESTKK